MAWVHAGFPGPPHFYRNMSLVPRWRCVNARQARQARHPKRNPKRGAAVPKSVRLEDLKTSVTLRSFLSRSPGYIIGSNQHFEERERERERERGRERERERGREGERERERARAPQVNFQPAPL